jgi:hypothetical protein
MSERSESICRWLKIAGYLILVDGLVAAVLVYLRAVPPEQNLSYIDPKYTKAYSAGMQVMGGQANVVVAEFREWIASLWHGHRLAYTTAVLSVFGALVCFRVAKEIEESTPRSES